MENIGLQFFFFFKYFILKVTSLRHQFTESRMIDYRNQLLHKMYTQKYCGEIGYFKTYY